MGDLRYHERKAKGLCVRCGATRTDGFAWCDDCRAQRPSRGPVLSRPSTAGAFNVCCQASGFHRVECREKTL